MSRSKTFITLFAFNWIAVFVCFFCLSTSANSQIAEDYTRNGLDDRSQHGLVLNPGAASARDLQLEVMAYSRKHQLELLQSEDALTFFKTATMVAGGQAQFLADLGAGAGIGLFLNTEYVKYATETEFTSDEPQQEFEKSQNSGAKIFLEITENIHAGMVIRYLYKEMKVIGNIFSDEVTSYNMTIGGYGAGGQFRYGMGRLGYVYYPPLRGKSTIQAEEMIVVEPGSIIANGSLAISDRFHAGTSQKMWIHEPDDRAEGTTGSDNQTFITLHGLTIDQYLHQQRESILGLALNLKGSFELQVAVGQQSWKWNVNDYAIGAGVNIRDSEAVQPVFYSNLYKVGLGFSGKSTTTLFGYSAYSRNYQFPEQMQSGKYSSDGNEVFALISTRL